MKLKHWQGYGSVQATKIEDKEVFGIFGEKHRQLKIKVKGNHEWGLRTDDSYTIYNWLVKRFIRNCPDMDNIESLNTEDDYEGGEEVCIYTILLPIDR